MLFPFQGRDPDRCGQGCAVRGLQHLDHCLSVYLPLNPSTSNLTLLTGHKIEQGRPSRACVICSHTCLALNRGMIGKTEQDISPTVSAAISDLMRYVSQFGTINCSLRWALTARSTISKRMSLNQHKAILLLGHSIPSRRRINSGWNQDLSRVMAVFYCENFIC